MAKSQCKWCKNRIETSSGVKAPIGFFCNWEHATEYGKKHGKKRQDEKLRERKREDRKRKQQLKSYAKKISELQTVFNELRRHEEFLWFKERNIEPYCISCLKPLGNDQWCNGHFKTTKARPELRFDKMNSYLQHNHRCNQMLSGDVENYKLGLDYRFGEYEAKRIIDYCESQHESQRYSDEEIEHLKKEWRKEIRRIKSLI